MMSSSRRPKRMRNACCACSTGWPPGAGSCAWHGRPRKRPRPRPGKSAMDRRDFLASKGTPHSVLLALGVEGPQTAEGLADYMAMEPRAVRKSLALLEGLGLVVRVGGRWALPAAVELSGKAGDSHDSRSAMEGKASSKRAGNGAGDARRASGVRGARPSSPPPSGSSSKRERKEEDEEEERRGPQTASERRVYRLLLEGGVGARSPKMGQLLALGLDPDYVAAFVTYRRRQIERGVEYPVSYLIQALQCGDPAPSLPRERSFIPKEYEDVVMR